MMSPFEKYMILLWDFTFRLKVKYKIRETLSSSICIQRSAILKGTKLFFPSSPVQNNKRMNVEVKQTFRLHITCRIQTRYTTGMTQDKKTRCKLLIT